MAEGNGHDRKAAREKLVRRIMELAPRQKLDAIISAADAPALLRSLPAHELYMAIVDVGLADATEIVQLASPEQFRTFVDLAAWQKDRMDPHEVLAWLRAARGDETDEFLKKVHGLDVEVLELMLRHLARVHDLEDNPDVHVDGVALETPEGRYLIELLVEGPEMSALRRLVEDLIAENPFEATRFFEAIRWELPSELEETAYRFRAARLADLGFPEPEVAMELFSYVDPDKHAPEPLASVGGAVSVQPGHERVDYVQAAFRGLTAIERQNLEDEVRYLVNAALVAEGAEPGDPSAVRRVSENARDTLNLGLEHLTGGRPERASDVVRELHLKRVFQVGFSLALKLKFRIDRLAAQPLARIGGQWMLLDAEAAVVKALHRKRPLRAPKVEGAEPTPFRSRRELFEAAAVVDRAERQLEIFAALCRGRDRLEALVTRFGAERLFAGAIVGAVLDGRAEPKPVPAGRLVELGERLFEGTPQSPSLRQSALSRAKETIVALVPEPAKAEAGSMVERVLQRLLSELGRAFLTENRIDPAVESALPIDSEP